MNTLKNLIDRLHEQYDIPDDLCDENVQCDDLDENTTSNLDGGMGQPQTPYAFRKKEKQVDDVSYSVPVTEHFFKKLSDTYIKLHERIQDLNEVSYNDYKVDDSKTERQKINSNILEINKKLREVEQMLNHAQKLKLETGSDQTVFWKGTRGSFLKIKERLTRLNNKIVEMTG